MGKHIWKRVEEVYDPPYVYGTITDYVETDDLTPPDGEGWFLVSAFGVGKVQGAGESPPRSSR